MTVIKSDFYAFGEMWGNSCVFSLFLLVKKKLIMKLNILGRFLLLGGLVLGIVPKIGAFNNIPTVYITTADSSAITSHDEWKNGSSVRIVLPDDSVVLDVADASVKARGHSTFTKPKKPYAIKLAEKSSLLGMTVGKRWVLLANFMDHSLLRNSLALEMAKQTCLEWTPDSRLVDVVVNGQLQGCYLLCEQVRVGKNRVNVDKDNGYLIEMDSYLGEEHYFNTKYRDLPVNIKAPQNPTPQQITAIEDYLNKIEEVIYRDSCETLENYIDFDTFADWWIVHELAQNAEPNGPRSCYMHKDVNGVLKAGPVWDFDLAFINVGLDAGGDIRPSRFNRTDVIPLTGDSIYNGNALWYGRLLKYPKFKNKVKERWCTLEPKFRALANDIDKWQSLIEESAIVDEKMWQGQDPALFDTFTTFRSSVENLKRVYLYRIDSLNKLLSE